MTNSLIPALRQASQAIVPRWKTRSDLEVSHALNLPGPRTGPLTNCPHFVFHIERPYPIDVWCVLQGQRDIPAWMQEPGKTV